MEISVVPLKSELCLHRHFVDWNRVTLVPLYNMCNTLCLCTDTCLCLDRHEYDGTLAEAVQGDPGSHRWPCAALQWPALPHGITRCQGTWSIPQAVGNPAGAGRVSGICRRANQCLTALKAQVYAGSLIIQKTAEIPQKEIFTGNYYLVTSCWNNCKECNHTSGHAWNDFKLKSNIPTMVRLWWRAISPLLGTPENTIYGSWRGPLECPCCRLWWSMIVATVTVQLNFCCQSGTTSMR